MRNLGIGFVVLASLAGTASADDFHLIETSNGVLAGFEASNAAGCLHTSGFFFTEPTADGIEIRVLSSTVDACGDTVAEGTTNGSAIISATQNGLKSATISGTVRLWDYQAQVKDVYLGFSLTFTGTGATQIQVNHGHSTSPGGSVIASFSADRIRAATTSGSLTLNGGGSGSLNPAYLGAGISGDLSIAR